MTEAIHRRSQENLDCHGAARLAMTDLPRNEGRGSGTPSPSSSHPPVIASPPPSLRHPRRHCVTPPSLRHPRPVIARNEAIHRPLNKGMDCHGAVRLAMTGRDRPAMMRVFRLETTRRGRRCSRFCFWRKYFSLPLAPIPIKTVQYTSRPKSCCAPLN